MVTVNNLNNIINTTTFIKTKFKNKRHVSCSSFKDQLSINTKNINKQTNNTYVNLKTKKQKKQVQLDSI